MYYIENSHLLMCGFVIAMLLAFRCHIFIAVKNLREQLFAKAFSSVSKLLDEILSHRKQKLFRVLGDMAAISKVHSSSLKIVEIGSGPGANFKYIPDNCELTCVDPNRHFEKILLQNADKFPGIKQVKFQLGKADDMTFLDTGSMDACICTYVFCSVDDMRRSLQEVKRILKTGGRLIFLEHVMYGSDSWLRKVQCLFRLPWLHLFGCRLTDQFVDSIHQAGFTKVEVERFEPEHYEENLPLSQRFLFKMTKPHVSGSAIK